MVHKNKRKKARPAVKRSGLVWGEHKEETGHDLPTKCYLWFSTDVMNEGEQMIDGMDVPEWLLKMKCDAVTAILEDVAGQRNLLGTFDDKRFEICGCDAPFLLILRAEHAVDVKQLQRILYRKIKGYL